MTQTSARHRPQIVAGLAVLVVLLSSGREARSASCDYKNGGYCRLPVNGVTRRYVLHVPANFQPGSSALVIAFHGARGNGAEFEELTQLDKTADRNGFAVAYPDGLPNSGGATSWNAYFNPTYGGYAPDDSAFTRKLITTLLANLRPDPKKIYATGLSAGGHMAHRAAIDISDLVAAAGVIAGSVWVQHAEETQRPPRPKAPVSILIVHGDDDEVVKYCGVENAKITEASQDESFDYWAHANSCASVSVASSLCTARLGSPTSVMVKSATGCSTGTEVRFIRLVGALHGWSAGQLNVPPGNHFRPYNSTLNSSTGTTTNDILWKFFAAHPKQ